MIVIGWLFSYYKLFCRKVFKIIFIVIKNLVLLICAKNIQDILKENRWQNFRSVLFFFTNIIIKPNKETEKNFPVKRFQVRWYIWLIHYIWAIWVILKIFLYMSIFYFFRYLKNDFLRHVWLVVIEHWKLRFTLFSWTLELIWFLLFWYIVFYRIGIAIQKDRRVWLGKFYRYIKLSKYIKKFRVYISRYFIVSDKFIWW